MKRITPSLVIACLALAVALSGTAAAASGLITGAQIKDHSIGMVDLSTLAVAKLRGQRGPAGPQGDPGAVGPAGPAGVNGGFDPAKISYVGGPAVSVAIGTTGNSTALCPAGTKATGGGHSESVWYGDNPYGSLYTVSQGPLSDGSGWTARLYVSASAPLGADITAYAVCAAH